MASRQPVTATIRAALDRGETIDDEMIRSPCSVVASPPKEHCAAKILAERKIHVAPSGSSGSVSIMLGNAGRVLPRSEVRLLVAALLSCADPGVGDRMADVERDLRSEIALGIVARAHDAPSTAADIAREMGLTLAMFEQARCEPFDVSPFRAELRRIEARR